MDLERFEELLLAEIDGRLTMDQRAQLDAACAENSDLARLRKNDLRVARMIRTIPPARVPATLAADIMHRFEMELAGERESERYEEPVHRSRPAYEEDPFETTSSGSRYREVYEPYREQVAVRSTVPWWSAIFGSTFMRLSFGMSVMILCIYMGSVIMKQSRNGGGGLPSLSKPEFEVASGAGTDEDGGSTVGALAMAEPVPRLSEARVAQLENANPTAIDLTDLVELTPLPPAEAEIPEDALAESARESDSVGRMDPKIEKMLAKNEGGDAAAESATEAAIAAIPSAAPVAATQPVPAVALQPAMQPAAAASTQPVVVAADKPQVDLPETEIAESAQASPQEKTVASAATPGPGMEQVFNRIKDDLDSQKSDAPASETAAAAAAPAASTPPGAREVKDVKELKAALDEHEMAAEPAKTVSGESQLANIMSEVDELRSALRGQSASSPTKIDSKHVSTVMPAPKEIAGGVPSPTAEKMKDGFTSSTVASKTSAEDRLRKIEMAIVRNGGTILGRRPDDKDPSATRVKVLMTRTQIRALESDLAKQGLAPAKKREDSSSDSANGDKPVEFEILVKSK